MLKRFRLTYLFIFLILITNEAFSQPVNSKVQELIIGSWDGAFIKSNSYQKIEIEFSEKQSKINSLQIMKEWHPTFGEFNLPVNIDSTGSIVFNTGYGKAIVRMDTNNLELHGEIQNTNPTIYLHLKKVPDAPRPSYTLEEVSINNNEVDLNGYLHIPKINHSQTAIILVGGRGCYPDATKYNLYAKLLREYDISVLAYHKRGTGKSTGDCSTAKITDLAEDLKQIYTFLKSHPNKYDKIGVLGISAGAWTMTKAEELVNFDFMISIVGPSTSVYTQQMQSAKYGSKVFNLETKAENNLINYTELVFTVTDNAKGFDQLNQLVNKSEKEGWRPLLEETDIAKTKKDISNLWVRRHNYDPKIILSAFNNPYLAIYGERDWIVPHNENTKLLKAYFSGNRKSLLTTVIAHNAEHGMETEATEIQLSNSHSYWHFYRIAPQVSIELINWLKQNEIIKVD